MRVLKLRLLGIRLILRRPEKPISNDPHCFYGFCSQTMARAVECYVSGVKSAQESVAGSCFNAWSSLETILRYNILWKSLELGQFQISRGTAFNSAHALGQLMAAKAVATSVFQGNKFDTPVVFQQRSEPISAGCISMDTMGSLKNSGHSEFKMHLQQLQLVCTFQPRIVRPTMHKKNSMQAAEESNRYHFFWTGSDLKNSDLHVLASQSRFLLARWREKSKAKMNVGA